MHSTSVSAQSVSKGNILALSFARSLALSSCIFVPSNQEIEFRSPVKEMTNERQMAIKAIGSEVVVQIGVCVCALQVRDFDYFLFER